MWTIYLNDKPVDSFTTDHIEAIGLVNRKDIMESLGFREGNHSHQFIKGSIRINLVWEGTWANRVEKYDVPEEYVEVVKDIRIALKQGKIY